MKIVGLVASLLMSLFSFSQNSYYFSEPLPLNGGEVKTVENKWYGEYSSLDQPSHYIINEDGIAIVATNISSITRETIRESSTYSVRNGFIHGVIKNDSIPCILKDELYYFGVQNKEIIIGSSTKNILFKVDLNGNYIINMFNNDNYIPAKVSFKNGTFSIAYFDYDFNTKKFNFINEKKSISQDDTSLVILSPNEKEVKRLFKRSVFGDQKIFKRK
jgi:hypothetical protein